MIKLLYVGTNHILLHFKVKENPNDSNTFRTFANGNIVPPIKPYPKWGGFSSESNSKDSV